MASRREDRLALPVCGGKAMWNYSFEIPILMILGIILLFYYSRPRLPIRRNRTFLMMVMTETVTIIADLLASMAANDHRHWNPVILDILNMFYFAAFFTRAFVMYCFAASVLKDRLEKKLVLKHLIRLPFYLGVLLSVLSAIFGSEKHHWFLYYTDASGYHSGTLYNLLYVAGFFYVFMALLSLSLFWRSLGRRREKYGILLYNLIIFVSLIIRITLPKYLIMDTFVLMAILVVFLAFENPEFFLDLRGYAFNGVALSEHLEENNRSLKLRPLGIVIHSFNEMRDIYGGPQMEEGLALIAKYIRQVFKKCLVFYCRNGRFLVLLSPDVETESQRKQMAERFTKPWRSPHAEIYLNVGFAEFEYIKSVFSPDIALNSLIKALDTVGNLYGRETLRITKDSLDRAQREYKIRQYIERAINDTGFELYLQPIVDTKRGRVVGAEALSRVRDDEGKIILPGDFIPVAENSGRIYELGELVFESTCRFIKEKGLDNLGIDWINVNLSPAQFVRADLAERFTAIAEKYGVDPSSVHLEITEGALIDDGFFRRQITALSNKGFKFVLDDYGTGYSNLARLKRCPFINIKIDMSIVWGYCTEPDAILPRMVQAFKDTGFSITAEGIEDEKMVETMKELGCDYLQGYHYSRPVPAADFANVIAEIHKMQGV